MKCENYTYLQEQEAESLAECCLATQPSAPSKSSLIVKKCSRHDSETASCRGSQSGTMFAHSTANHGEAQLTFFAEVSPAKTLVQRVKVQELPDHVQGFGKNMRDSLARYGLDLSLPKTHLCCGLGDLELSSKIWPRWGMMQGGELWELGMSVRLIDEIECGSWPTPTRRDWKGANAPAGLTRKDGKSRMDQLPNAVAYPELGGGTKTRQKYPTPTRQDFKRRGPNSKQQGLSNWEPASKGQLNPSWVEWLIGWLIGWTDLKPLEMDRFQQWQQQHSEFFRKD